MSKNTWHCMLVSAGTALALLPAGAAARGPYLGVDVAHVTTQLNYGFAERYATDHLRLKAGYEFRDGFALEFQLLSPADATDVDPVGEIFEFEIGVAAGLYVKPRAKVERGGVYGLFGVSVWDTRYGPTAIDLDDRDTVVAGGLGIGGDFNITPHWRFNVDVMAHVGSVRYSRWLSADFRPVTVAVGMSYRF